jgi:SOS-response transcriptional repressor LexA
MTKKSAIPQKLQPWVDARKRHRLSHAQVQMARELGLNPKKLGKIANHYQEPWKMPLPQFIEHLYRKRFGRPEPVNVRSIERVAADQRRKKEERRARKAEARDSGKISDTEPPF